MWPHRCFFFYILAIIYSFLIHFPFRRYVFSVCSLHPVLTGPVRQISLNLSLPLSLPKIVLHPSISSLLFLPTLYLICLILSHLPSDFADSLYLNPRPHHHPDLLHISLLSSLGSLVPLSSFPHANCWNVLAISGVSLPSSSSSCHIFHEKRARNHELSLLFGSCVAAWWHLMPFQDQEEPEIRQSQCRSMWCVWEYLMDAATKEWHI